jgi:hypothetical protein
MTSICLVCMGPSVTHLVASAPYARGSINMGRAGIHNLRRPERSAMGFKKIHRNVLSEYESRLGHLLIKLVTSGCIFIRADSDYLRPKPTSTRPR